MLDEMERALHDSLSIIKRTLESGAVVPGGAAVEAALSIYLENFATTLGSREQLAIAEFAAALLIIPKTLATNAAKDSTDLVAKLRAYHNAAQTASAGHPKKALMNYGLDLLKGEVRDNIKAGVLEPTVSKVKSLKSALEAATSLLRIDDGPFPFPCSLPLPPPLPSADPVLLTRLAHSHPGRARAAGRRWRRRPRSLGRRPATTKSGDRTPSRCKTIRMTCEKLSRELGFGASRCHEDRVKGNRVSSRRVRSLWEKTQGIRPLRSDGRALEAGRTSVHQGWRPLIDCWLAAMRTVA
jgi:hypothetical protein